MATTAYREKKIPALNERFVTTDIRKIDTDQVSANFAQYRWYVNGTTLYRLTGRYICGITKDQFNDLKNPNFGKMENVNKEDLSAPYKPIKNSYEFYADGNIFYEAEAFTMGSDFLAGKRFVSLTHWEAIGGGGPGTAFANTNNITVYTNNIVPHINALNHAVFNDFRPRKRLVKRICEKFPILDFVELRKCDVKKLDQKSNLNVKKISYLTNKISVDFSLAISVGGVINIIGSDFFQGASYSFTHFAKDVGDYIVPKSDVVGHTWQTIPLRDLTTTFDLGTLSAAGNTFAHNNNNIKLCNNIATNADNTLIHQIRYVFDKLFVRFGAVTLNGFFALFQGPAAGYDVIDTAKTPEQLKEFFEKMTIANDASEVTFEQAYIATTIWVRIYKYFNIVHARLDGADNAMVNQDLKEGVGGYLSGGNRRAIDPTNVFIHLATFRGVGGANAGLVPCDAAAHNGRLHATIFPLLARITSVPAADAGETGDSMQDITLALAGASTGALSLRTVGVNPNDLIYSAEVFGPDLCADMFLEIATERAFTTYTPPNAPETKTIKLVRKSNLKLA